MAEPKTFTLRTEFITLGQLLKAANVVNSGGEVKAYLAVTDIKINNTPDTRRGRKLRVGDKVKFPDGLVVEIV